MVPDLRPQQAVDLRVAGLSRSQIMTALGLRNSKMLNAWLHGVPPPDWTERPRAKDNLRAHALALRLEGKSYNDICREFGVSKSTLSLWLRDVPLTEEHRQALKERSGGPPAKRAQALRARHHRRDETIVAAARDEITEMSGRELFLAGVVAYWAEGSKNKPWGRNTQATFINSDPGMIRLFLAWLRLLGIGNDRLIFRVSIHESAYVDGAVAHWAKIAGASPTPPPKDFQRTTLKRHNRKPTARTSATTTTGAS